MIFFSGIAQAQQPGAGDTRPAEPAARERSGPAEDAGKDAVKDAGAGIEAGKTRSDSDRAIARCNALSGDLREDCLRQKRTAGTGGTRATEPATAPPPQNPR